MIEAVVFDFDGVILETESHVFEAWRIVFEQHGQDLPLSVWIDCLGKPSTYRDFYSWLGELTGSPVDRQAILEQRERYTTEAIEPQPAMPGVIDYLKAATARGVKLAVASGSSHGWVDGHLERLGLIDHFAAIVCGEDTTEHKPGPAPYLEAARQVGADPTRCIAIEDSPNGIASAAAAGMYALAVPTEMTRGLDFPGACERVASLADLPFNELVDRALATTDE